MIDPPKFDWNESTHAAIKAAQEFSGPLLNDHVELIERLKEDKDIIRFDDGYWYFWPDSTRGAFRANQLRAIADELDRLNTEAEKNCNEYLSKDGVI
jgi:hypothetical protein